MSRVPLARAGGGLEPACGDAGAPARVRGEQAGVVMPVTPWRRNQRGEAVEQFERGEGELGLAGGQRPGEGVADRLVGLGVAPAVDCEFVQRAVGPAERSLKHPMQRRQLDARGHEQAAPDARTDVEQLDPQLPGLDRPAGGPYACDYHQTRPPVLACFIMSSQARNSDRRSL